MLVSCWTDVLSDRVIFLLLLIARSKLVPDFALTIHLLNLIVTSFYTGHIPSQTFWWGLQFASAGLMVFLGMWACQWRELKPIAFGGKGKDRASGKGKAKSGEEAVGLMQGSGTDGGGEGAGVYEMVGLTAKDDAV